MIVNYPLSDFDKNGFAVLRGIIDEYLIRKIGIDFITKLKSLYTNMGYIFPESGEDYNFRAALMNLISKPDFSPENLDKFDIMLPYNPFSIITEKSPINLPDSVFSLLTDAVLLDSLEQLLGGAIMAAPNQHCRMKLPAAQRIDTSRQHKARRGEALYKTTVWHQDMQTQMPQSKDSMIITAWIPMHDVDEESGCLVVAKGYHRLPQLLPFPVPEAMAEKLDHGAIALPVRRGDVVLLHKRTPHASVENRSSEIRWSFDFRYYPEGQASSRPYFPSFLVRSASNPNKVTRSAWKWRSRWEGARRHFAQSGKLVPGPRDYALLAAGGLADAWEAGEGYPKAPQPVAPAVTAASQPSQDETPRNRSELREAFNESGYLLVRGVVDPARYLAPLEQEYSGLLTELERGWDVKSGGCVRPDMTLRERLLAHCSRPDFSRELLEQLDITLPYNPFSVLTKQTPVHLGKAVFGLLTCPEILDVVQRLLGPEICASPDQHYRAKLPEDLLPPGKQDHRARKAEALYKTTIWHQDALTQARSSWNTEILTVWIPMHDVGIEDGPLVVAPGFHKRGDLLNFPATPSQIAEMEARQVALEARAGDIVILHKKIPHASLPNRSGRVRWSFDFRYYPVSGKSNRPWFPSFVVRSQAPETVVRFHEEWRSTWLAARDRFAEAGTPVPGAKAVAMLAARALIDAWERPDAFRSFNQEV